ncbi:DUF6365 family protein [Dactylosporangium sp. NPDC050688]|uniref:DUF6365 family protein n=1 Tax=Dactylosporangium sp. NPDC050688 TaxID=3157217 RepID=UPI0033F443F8
MRVLFIAPSRLSRGDATIAADLARGLPRPTYNSGFHVGFVAAAEAVPQLHDLGMPALPLSGATPAENLTVLDRIVKGFGPDVLVLADAYAVQQSNPWSGLTVGLLRERYGRPVAGVDRLGWQAAGYTADCYGGAQLHLPPLLDDCDLVIQPGPPHPAAPGTAGVAVAALPPGGLRGGGLRDSGQRADTAPDGRPTVFLVNSAWEYRNRQRSMPVAQLIDALPAVLHSHLAALGRPLRVVHVGPRRWRFTAADHLDYQHFNRMPYAMFQARLAAADVFVTTNALSMTLAQAVLGGVPALLLDNHERLGPDGLPGWLSGVAPQLRSAHPYRVAPLGWHDLLEPLLSAGPYGGCFATAGIFDRTAVLDALGTLLDDEPARDALRRRQSDYRAELAGLPAVGDALRAVVTG